MSEAYIPGKNAPNIHGLTKTNDRKTQGYPEGVTLAEHVAHDMRVGRFPEQSTIKQFLAERQSGEAVGTEPLRLALAETTSCLEDAADILNQLGYLTRSHRDAAERARAYLSQPEQPANREVAWMIERKYPVNSIGATEPHWYAERGNGEHWWTPVPNEGKRFASKADAEAFPAYQMIAGDPTISLTEHVWINDSFSWSHGRATQPEQPALAAVGEGEVTKAEVLFSTARRHGKTLALAAYQEHLRQMRDEVVPEIERELKEQARAAVFLRQGRTDPPPSPDVAELREHIRKQAEDIMTLGRLVYDENAVEWKARAEALQAENERLREALKPFASLPAFVDDNKWSDDALISAKNGASRLLLLRLGDFRRARALLSRLDTSKTEERS